MKPKLAGMTQSLNLEVNPRRGTYYNLLCKSAESAENHDSASGSRLFSALEGKVYEGPLVLGSDSLLSAELQEISNTQPRTPTYIDDKGNIYCADYCLLNEKSNELSTSADTNIFEQFPSPKNYKSYAEYNESLSQWYSNAQSFTKNIFLPNVTGRCYYRPRVDLYDEESEIENSTKNVSLSPVAEDQNELGDNQSDTLLVEPWDTVLMPVEPEANSFQTFAAYEKAMKRWAYICSKHIKIIPPHPSQLSNLILLRTATERKVAERSREEHRRKTRPTEVASEDTEANEAKPLSYKLYKHDPMESHKNETPRRMRPIDVSFAGVEFERMLYENEEEILKSIHDPFTKSLRRREQEEISPTKLCGARTYLPLIRSKYSLTPPISSFFTEEEQNIGNTPSIASDFPLGYAQSLRPNHELFFRSPVVIRSASKKTGISETEKKQITKLLCGMENEAKLSSFYSWFPSNNPKLSEDTGDWKFDEQNPVTSIKTLLLREQYLDDFEAMLNDAKKPLLNEFTRAMSKDFFSKLLRLHHEILSPLAHAKLGCLVASYMQTAESKNFLMNFFESLDYKSLATTANILNECHATKISIFPFWPSTEDLVHQNVKNEGYIELITLLLCGYYLQTMEEITNQKFFAETLFPIVQTVLGVAHIKIAAAVEKQLNFLISLLPRLLNHRSQQLSQFFVVITSYLLSFNSCSTVLLLLGQEEVQFVSNIRKLCNSKLRHVRFSGEKLLTQMLHNRGTRTTLLRTFYSQNENLVMEDLFSTSQNSKENSFLSSFVVSYADREFKAMTRKGFSPSMISTFSFLLKGGREQSIFHFIFKTLDNSSHLLNSVFINATRFMYNILVAYNQLEIIEVYETQEASNRSMSHNRNLLIVPDDLHAIFAFFELHDLTGVIGDEIKLYLYRCARILAKPPIIFDSIIKDKHFFTGILRGCRDSKDYKVNKEAWKFFFKSFQEHHSFLLQMDSTCPFLNQIFELISPGVSDIVITNCLHYISKILQLPEKEFCSLQKTSCTSRGDEDIKSIEKDVKKFSSILVKHCLKVHLVFKRLEFNNIGGAPFLSIANFYNVVYLNHNKTNIGGSKLYRELTKNKDYKQNLSKVVKMFSMAKESSPSSTSGVSDSPSAKNSPMNLRKESLRSSRGTFSFAKPSQSDRWNAKY